MKNILNFLLKVDKLKKMPRTGWILREIRNPETIAEHTFRMTIAAWLLAEKKGLDIEKTIKNALVHDLCEVYAGDVTPFFYYINLPKDKIKRKKMLMKWVRLSKQEKEKKGKKKYEIEKKSLLKLIKPLKPELRKKILSSWLDFEEGITNEGKFVRPVDKIETLIQAIEYFGNKEDTPVASWWEEVEELVDEPLFLNFLKVIQNKFYITKTSLKKKIDDKKLKRELEGILDFLLEIGKLKRMPRRLWVSLEVKDPETVSSHIFTVSLMALIFGQEKKELNMGKLLKMALCHEMSSVYTGDLITPFGITLIKTKREGRKIFEKWPRLSKIEKEKKFLKDYQKEKTALEKLTQSLPTSLREEIIQLFNEYKNASTAEARFLNQVNVLAVLLQSLQYQKKDKELPVGFLWEWAFEKCDDQMCLEFIEELKRKFYKKSFIFELLNLLYLRKRKR